MYSNRDTDIAVIGMAGRFPGAANIDEYWRNLINGIESISFFSEEELTEFGISKSLLHNKNYVKAKGCLQNTDCFDSQFFKYTLKEASLMNPQTRLFHECVYTALEDAGYSKINPDNKIGLFAGASSDETWRKYLNIQNDDNIASQFNSELLINKDFMCSCVAYKLGLKGPCYAINTACSTSLAAVHMACQSILDDECELAIAGGASITFPQKNGYIYAEGMLNSPDGHCCALDKDSKGTVEGNGVGAVVIKRLSNAIKDKDIVYAIIKGSAVNNDGNNKLNFTAPSPLGIEAVVKEAYKKAAIDYKTVKYIEMHGTGTPLGDAIEITALKSAFNGQCINECMIGSVKANIGHLDAAAGIAGFIKTVLILYYKQIPPMINFNSPNNELTMDNKIFSVNTNLIDINIKTSFCAGVNSFGQGGTNVHVVLENFIKIKDKMQKKPGNIHLMLFSAKTQESLQNYINSLYGYIKSQVEIDLSDISYTLAMRKNHYNYRAYLLARNYNDLYSEFNIYKVNDNSCPKVILVCDGNNRVNKEQINYFLNQYPSFEAYINKYIDTEHIINNFENINERDKILILIGILSLIEEIGIKIDGYIGYGIGIFPLLNLVANISLDNLLNDELIYYNTNQRIKCNFPIYNPQLHNFVNEISLDAIRTCYEMKTIPECVDLFKENNFFIHVNVTDLLYINKSLYNTYVEDNKHSIEAIVGELWANGNLKKPEQVFRHKNYNKIHLPNYIFEKTKHKLPMLFNKESINDIKLNYYKLNWKLDECIPSPIDIIDCVLIFVYPQYIKQTIKYFQRLKCEYIIAEVGNAFIKKSDNHFVFDAENQYHYDYIFHAIAKQNLLIKYVINLMPVSLLIGFSELESNNMININMLRLRHIVIGIIKFGPRQDIVIANITEKLHNLKCPNETNFSFAGLSGIQEVISKEYMNISCVNVDFSDVNNFKDDIFNCILQEISINMPVKTVVYDYNYRFVPEINELIKDEYESPPRIINNGVYIILGGTGRIGKVITNFIGQVAKCTIILTGLNSISCNGLVNVIDEKITEYVDAGIYHELEEISQNGSKILISRVNILDKDNTLAFFDNVYKQFGKINGIVNCVGVTGIQYNKVIEDIKTEVIEQQLHIREKGLVLLDAILDNYDYDFCILFSSIASILGGTGQFGYAGACSFMDKYIKTRNHNKDKKWEVINIDTWITENRYDQAYHLVPYDVTVKMLNFIFKNKAVNDYDYIITFTDIYDYIYRNKSIMDRYHSKSVVEISKNKVEVIANIWKDIFGRNVALFENFFDIGGDSLKALEIISCIRNKLNVRLTIKDLYSCQTIDKLVKLIEKKFSSSSMVPEVLYINQYQEYYECSYCQKEMFIPKNNVYPTRYNLTCIYSVDGEIDLARLNIALNKIVKRHEIYRTSFVVYNNEYHQKIADDFKLEIKHIHTDDIDAAIESFIISFDLSVLPLIKMQLVTRNKDGKQYLFTDMHHAIFDDQSVRMFFDELLSIYSGNALNNNIKQFKDYSCMQHQSYCKGAYLVYQKYWLQKLSIFSYTELVPDVYTISNCYKRVSYNLVSEEQYDLIVQFAVRKNMSLSSLILSIWMLVISYYTSQEYISVGLRITNRLRDFKNTMGCFLEKVILMIKVNKKISLELYLNLFEREYNETLENSFYPFYLLTQDYKRDRLFSIIFNYMVVTNTILSNDEIKLIPYKYKNKSLRSKYNFNFRILDDKCKVLCSLKYKSSSYSDKYIENMFMLFKKILSYILNNNTEIAIEKIFIDKMGDIFYD